MKSTLFSCIVPREIDRDPTVEKIIIFLRHVTVDSRAEKRKEKAPEESEDYCKSRKAVAIGPEQGDWSR